MQLSTATPKTLNPQTAALNQAHVTLMQQLLGLENLVRVPEKIEPNDTTYHLVRVRQELSDHFRFEEEGGYMEAAARSDPALAPAMDGLKADHRRLAADLDQLINDARQGKAQDQAFAQRVRDWVAAVRRHECEENRLFQDTFTLDVTASS